MTATREATEILAAVSRGADRPFSLETARIHGPGPGQILVRMVACGVCHTDLVVRSMVDGPVVLGHEGAGVVESAGSDVTDVVAGDAVVLSFRACGLCRWCAAGHRAYCEQFPILNLPRVPEDDGRIEQGGTALLGSFFGQSSFATHVVANAADSVVVTPDTDLALAAPLGCGIQTGAGTVLNVLRPQPDDTFVVFGGGGVGLAAAMIAVAREVRTVLVVDPVPDRRELAISVGATAAIDPTTTDVVAAIRRHAPGGATHALDTTGIPAVVAQAVTSVGRFGSVVAVGAGNPDVTVNIRDMISSGKTLRGSTEGDAQPRQLIPELLRLHSAGQLPLEKIITRYRFADIESAAADSLSGRTVKPVLLF